jgi:hypothetical protein
MYMCIDRSRQAHNPSAQLLVYSGSTANAHVDAHDSDATVHDSLLKL